MQGRHVKVAASSSVFSSMSIPMKAKSKLSAAPLSSKPCSVSMAGPMRSSICIPDTGLLRKRGAVFASAYNIMPDKKCILGSCNGDIAEKKCIGLLTLWLTPAAAQDFLASCMHCSSLSHATRRPSWGSACSHIQSITTAVENLSYCSSDSLGVREQGLTMATARDE